MSKIIINPNLKTCPSCGCGFEYNANDVHVETEQYWAGFWKAWQFRDIRYVKCPGCGKCIVLH